MKLQVRWRGETKGIDKGQVLKALEMVAKEQGLKGKVEIGMSLVDRKEMMRLNRKYMGKEGVTDVLSFPLEKEVGPDEVMRLGDIVICLAEAKGQKITFLVKHAMLHLLGIHHK